MKLKLREYFYMSKTFKLIFLTIILLKAMDNITTFVALNYFQNAVIVKDGQVLIVSLVEQNQYFLNLLSNVGNLAYPISLFQTIFIALIVYPLRIWSLKKILEDKRTEKYFKAYHYGWYMLYLIPILQLVFAVGNNLFWLTYVLF